MFPFTRFRFLLHVVGGSARHLYNLSESILIGSTSLQAYRYLVGAYRFVRFQMHVPQALFRIAAPNQLIVGIHL